MVTRKRRIRVKKRFLWLVLATFLLLLAATVVACQATKRFSSGDRLAPNVRIQGIEVGNLPRSQAAAEVEKRWVATLPAEITLKWAQGKAEASAEDLGRLVLLDEALADAHRVGREGNLLRQIVTQISLLRSGADIPVRVDVDRDRLESYLKELADEVYQAPKNADIDVEGDKVHVIPGKTGVELDIEATGAKLASILADPEQSSVQVAVKVKQPAISAEDLSHLEVVLASYTTRFRPSQVARTHNLRLAIKSLGRTVVMPGDVLSFNQRTGPRLAERGFREAPIFVDGEVEPSTGGGVCQVATTVYNAALLANLTVVERHKHSRPVTYAPSGRDATIYWGQADLRIRNTLGHPILVIGSIGDSSMTVKILGSREDRYEVELERSGIATISHATREIPSSDVEPGKREVDKPGRNGTRVTLTRVVKRGGKVVKTERLHTDTYSPQTRIVKVGPPKPEVTNEVPPDNAIEPGAEEKAEPAQDKAAAKTPSKADRTDSTKSDKGEKSEPSPEDDDDSIE